MTTVLSVQSRVAAGYVGNSAASFCLERTGVNVWSVDTLLYSNHPGHGGFTGKMCSGGEVYDLAAGIDARFGLESADALLSGYLGRAETGESVLKIADLLKRKNPSAPFCCDPVMGDGGRIYVAQDIPDLMKFRLVPRADIITPNRFELELLTGRTVNTAAEAVEAARSLMKTGRPRLVTVTGIEDEKRASISVLSISRDEAFVVSTPALSFSKPPCGTGDMLTALFLGRLLSSKSVPEALSFSVSAVFGILSATFAAGARSPLLIEAQKELETPSRLFACAGI